VAVAESQELFELGIPAVILFGIPEKKDEVGSEAWDESAAVQETVRRLKREAPGLAVVTDGADRALARARRGRRRGSLRHDGRSGWGHPEGARRRRVRLRRDPSYAAKYASAFYGPFREAADSAPKFGDRRGYQIDPGNGREAMREIALDLEEGADIVMVKPALAYLDIVREARRRFDVPLAAYNVSGEYAMVKAAAERGWIEERRIALEILTSIVRAGADFVLTYHAKEAAKWLREG
jgi:porphobilinogen synthase